MRPNLGYYVQVINKIVTDTEEIGEEMNPSYEVIRDAIDNNKVAELSSEQLAEVVETFNQGTVKYQTMLQTISEQRPPAKVMGIHKKLERSYEEYVEGCKEMVASVNPENGVDIASFERSEKKQDQATDDISNTIQRMTKVLLKK